MILHCQNVGLVFHPCCLAVRVGGWAKQVDSGKYVISDVSQKASQ